MGGTAALLESALHPVALCRLPAPEPCGPVSAPRAGGSGRAVIDFTAAWCGPCKMISPAYEELAAEHTAVRFFKVDIDNAELSSVVMENNITAVPTFVAYVGLDRVGAMSGADRAALRRMVKELSGSGG